MKKQLTKEEINALKDEWGTPPWFFDWLEELLGVVFELDPCASDDNVKCPRYYTKEMDGLIQDWSEYGPKFINPPYSAPMPWVEKAVREKHKSTALIAMLLLADTSTQWYHLASRNADLKITLRPRLRHVPPEGLSESSNRNGSVVFVFNLDVRVLEEIKRKFSQYLAPELTIDLLEIGLGENLTRKRQRKEKP